MPANFWVPVYGEPHSSAAQEGLLVLKSQGNEVIKVKVHGSGSTDQTQIQLRGTKKSNI